MCADCRKGAQYHKPTFSSHHRLIARFGPFRDLQEHVPSQGRHPDFGSEGSLHRGPVLVRTRLKACRLHRKASPSGKTRCQVWGDAKTIRLRNLWQQKATKRNNWTTYKQPVQQVCSNLSKMALLAAHTRHQTNYTHSLGRSKASEGMLKRTETDVGLTWQSSGQWPEPRSGGQKRFTF